LHLNFNLSSTKCLEYSISANINLHSIHSTLKKAQAINISASNHNKPSRKRGSVQSIPVRNQVKHPSLDPGIKQGHWELRPDYTSAHKPDYKEVWVSESHIPIHCYWEVFAAQSVLDERERVRNKYNKSNCLKSPVQSLQINCLKAYSRHHYRTIDSIELEFRIGNQRNLIHRVVLQDKRTLPIKFSSLKPYSIQELQEFAESSYQEWYRAGGYFEYRFYRHSPCFWIDLWQIVHTEQPILLEWRRGSVLKCPDPPVDQAERGDKFRVVGLLTNKP